MLKRTIVLSSAMSVSLRYGQLVITPTDRPEDKHTVPIEDMGMLLVEGKQITLTVPVMTALVEGGVQVVMCDKRGMPAAMLQSLNGGNTQCKTLHEQIDAAAPLNKQLWRQLVESKIHNQARLLNKTGDDGDILRPYYSNVKSGDPDNREGAAARLYFPRLFGADFVRDRTLPGVNALLNYGYTILRAAVARSLVSSGLFPALGIHHHHRLNAFPLADDVMEPFRPFVDDIVYDLALQGQLELDKETKAALIRVLYADTHYGDLLRPLSVGLSMTTASLVRCYAREEHTLALPVLA